jgi:hypothetical protein
MHHLWIEAFGTKRTKRYVNVYTFAFEKNTAKHFSLIYSLAILD